MRVKVDVEMCRGHGVCVAEAPEVFDLDPESQRVVLLREPGAADREAVEKAVRHCPTFALSLED